MKPPIVYYKTQLEWKNELFDGVIIFVGYFSATFA